MSIFLLLGLVNVASAAELVRDFPEPVRADWMKADPFLSQPTTIDVNAKPLGVLLDIMSLQSHCILHTERELKEYRVTLHLKSQPLWKAMGRLQDLFGHGNIPNKHYEWSRNPVKNGNPTYLLYRRHSAIEEEQALLDMPKQISIKWLRELLKYINLPPEKQIGFAAECPCLKFSVKNKESLLDGDFSPLGEAFRTLRDTQLLDMVSQGHIDLTNLSLSEQAQKTLKPFPTNNKLSSTEGAPSNASSGATLTFEQDPNTNGAFFLSMSTPDSYCSLLFGFDTQYELAGLLDDTEMQLPPPDKQGPVIDLSSLLKRRDTDPIPRTLPFDQLLTALAKASGLNIYTEAFPRWPIILDKTRGTPEELLTYACARAGYRWRRIGADFLVYSKSWAQDRRANIPQPLLDQWIANCTRNGRTTLEDLAAMSAMREEQIRVLRHWMDVQAGLSTRNLDCLRLLSTLSPHDFHQVYEPQGVQLEGLDSVHQAIAQKIFKDNTIGPIRISAKRDADLPIFMNGRSAIRKSMTITLVNQFGVSKDYWTIEPLQQQPQLTK